jgi:hypothetical protein
MLFFLEALSMDWTESEYNLINLGDKRLNKRAKTLLKQFSDKPTESIPVSCKSWAETKAAYRFFDNGSVTAKKIFKPHRMATLNRIKEHPLVLLIQDTTTLNYSGQKERQDLGPIQQDNVRGIFLHPTLTITPNCECLGVIDYEQWAREKFTHQTSQERKAQRYSKAIKDKESYRWVRGYKKANKLAKAIPTTRFIYIADREGDIYDIYHETRQVLSHDTADYLIRATFDRCILDEDAAKKRNKLKATVKATSSVGKVTFTVSPGRNRKKREVTQDIFIKQVRLTPPREKAKAGFTSVKVTVIIATETNVPPGEKAIEWVLLTSIPVSDLESALQVIQWYLCRWQIEIYFKILKSGCNIEKLQLNDKQRFNPCLAMYLIIAWRILFLTMQGRSTPTLNSECLFDRIEWQTAYVMLYQKPPPSKTPSLQEVLRMIAQLGGFLGRKHDGDPGPIVMWKGLQNLHEHIRAREAFQNAFGHTYG